MSTLPPDAGMSLLGTYGLRNPMMVWLLNRRPDLLAETSKELAWQPGTPPVCGDAWEQDSEGMEKPWPTARLIAVCERRMLFRYVLGRPAWVCLAHSGDDDSYPYYYRFIERPTPKMQTVPTFDLFSAIRASLDGASLDLRWDDRRGEWAVQETRA